MAGLGSKRGRPWRVALMLTGASFVACGSPTEPAQEDPNDDPPVAGRVAVSSPVGDRMAVGRAVQLEATASGVQPGSFSWASSDEAVATVSGQGLVTGVGSGSVTISASAGSAAGQYAMAVEEVDLERLSGLLSDPFVQVLAVGQASAVEAALGDCAAALDQGHLINLEACPAATRSALDGLSDPDHRALGGVLLLIVDQFERLLDQ